MITSKVISVLESGDLAFGKYVEEFQCKFSKYSGTQYNIGFNSATSGAEAIWNYIKNQYGSCIIEIPTLSFASPAYTAKKTGHKVVFVDIDDNLQGVFSDNPLTIKMPISYGGVSIKKPNNGIIVSDSAHSTNTAVGDFCFYSFHPNKPLRMSQGGIISTNDKSAADFLFKYRNFGRENIGSSYDIVQPGTKSYMTNLDACIGIESLKTLSDERGIRKRNHGLFEESKLQKIGRFVRHDYFSSYHLCSIILDNSVGIKIRNKFNIPFHYPLLHKTTFWNSSSTKKLPNAENLEKRIVNLPIHHSIKTSIIKEMIENIYAYVCNI